MIFIELPDPASVICRMEQADYEGSLPMLRRIAGALNPG
jgi:hypothetical protein